MQEMILGNERRASTLGMASARVGEPPVKGGGGPAKDSDAKERLLELLVEMLLSVAEPRFASGAERR